MKLLVMDAVSLAFGLQPLMDKVDFTLEKGERVCLVGRNGTGKSSMMKVIRGQQKPDDGELRFTTGVNLAYLDQALPEKTEQTLYQFVASGLAEMSDALERFNELGELVAKDPSPKNIRAMEEVQQLIDSRDAWHLDQKIENTLTRLNLSGEQKLANLSGGWRRRADLARALVQNPDILLLDEPTNHLDLENIEWLEKTLLNFSGALLFITHDRYFADQLATRIVELDRGQLTSWPGNFKEYLVKKDEQLAIEERHNALFDKRLAQEETWIRQGIKARRTRNEGRVRALKAMREKRQQRLKRDGKSSFNVESAERSGKVVAKLRNVCFHHEAGKPIVDRLSMHVSRGDKIGIIGPNGSGKTTLIQLILGELQPVQGTIKHGTNLELAYFDQMKSQLDVEKTVIDNVADGKDYVEINGKPRHAIGYLQDFLFTPERIRTPVKALSGGESNRLLLAKIFAKPSNLIILDEPTNDLDIETLELLEQVVVDYEGTVLIVSHDREFLNNVITSSLVFEGEGKWQEYVGSYDDWLRQRDAGAQSKAGAQTASNKSDAEDAQTSDDRGAKPRDKKPNKLSYKDQRALELLPKQIEELENAIEALQAKIGAADFFQQSPETTQPVLAELSDKEAELGVAFDEWERLESLQQSFNQ